MDASNLPGVLWAERHKQTIVMLASPNRLDLITEKQQPWKGVWNALRRRIAHFPLGWQFTEINNIRKQMGLDRYHMPSDYFNAAVEVFLYPPIDLTASLPAHIRPIQLHAPQCVFCDRNFPVCRNITVAIMPMELSLKDARAIIRGIHLARMSFQQQAIMACETNQESLECTSFQARAELKAVMLVEQWPIPYIPELVPSFLAVESSHILDAISRHSGTCVVISHCDQFSTMPAMAGMSLICIPKKSVPLDAFATGGWVTTARGNDIARSVIRGVMENNKEDMMIKLQDLSNSVDVLETLAFISRDNRLLSTNQRRLLLREHIPILTATLSSDPTSLKWIGTYFAVGFLLLAAGYTLLFIGHINDPSQIPAFHRKFSLGSGLFAELDHGLIQFQQWLRDDNSIHNVLSNTGHQTMKGRSPDVVQKQKTSKKR